MRKYFISTASFSLGVAIKFCPPELIPISYRALLSIGLFEIAAFSLLITLLTPSAFNIKEPKKMLPILVMVLGAIIFTVGSLWQYSQKKVFKITAEKRSKAVTQPNVVIHSTGPVIVTQNQSGGNNSITFNNTGRHLDDDLESKILQYVDDFKGQPIQIKTDTSSDEARQFGKEVLAYLLSMGYDASIDSTSTYIGTFKPGITFYPTYPIIQIGLKD